MNICDNFLSKMAKIWNENVKIVRKTLFSFKIGALKI